MLPARSETEKFLKALDTVPSAFTFQTFDDNAKRKDKNLVRVLHGTLEQHWETLCKLNKQGAGIYITVNETDLKGRAASNTKRIRAFHADLDGAPLTPALTKPVPHIVVESSPKRWHVYWLVKDMPVDAKLFREAQKKIIKRLNSDRKITDLSRVLRLPGFVHQKGKPFRVRVVKLNDNKPYKAVQFINGLQETETREVTFSSNLPPVELKDISAALEVIPSDNYQIWFEIGCALNHELGDSGFEIFDRWSRKSDKYDKTQCKRKWSECEKITKYSVGTIFHYATEADPRWKELEDIPEDASIEDFVAYMPSHNYVYLPTGQSWPAASVNARLPKQQAGNKRIAPSIWLDRFRKVEGLTWSPGDPEMIPDRVAREQGGWINKPGTMTLNTYYAPIIKPGDARKVSLWVDLVHEVFPGDAKHIINWLAHRVQHPGTKINHCLLLGGEQGVGKDTILEPVKHAVGPWNFTEISPKDVVSRFNAHVKSVICRISEARDLGDVDRYDFYEHLKTITTSPPDIIQCEEKHMKKYAVSNVTGVIITTNYKTGGIYLPVGDRRTYVAWTHKTRDSFPTMFWDNIWNWYRSGGFENVAAYLRSHDIRGFNPKTPPAKTEAFLDIVEANLPQEDAEFAEAIHIIANNNKVDRQMAVTLDMINDATPSHSFAKWLEERRNHRTIPHRLESCGYAAVRNPDSQHNRWQYRVHDKISGNTKMRETSIFALRDLGEGVRVAAARALLSKLQEDSRK